jgi:hypothetical protein
MLRRSGNKIFLKKKDKEYNNKSPNPEEKKRL